MAADITMSSWGSSSSSLSTSELSKSRRKANVSQPVPTVVNSLLCSSISWCTAWSLSGHSKEFQRAKSKVEIIASWVIFAPAFSFSSSTSFWAVEWAWSVATTLPLLSSGRAKGTEYRSENKDARWSRSVSNAGQPKNWTLPRNDFPIRKSDFPKPLPMACGCGSRTPSMNGTTCAGLEHVEYINITQSRT